MFTINQLEEAHKKIKSGNEFPLYIKEINELGVDYYEVFVSDGHTDFFGTSGHKVSSKSKYDTLYIISTPQAEKFKLDLLAHQKGEASYLTFCNDCAQSGIEKWVVDMKQMTCAYYDTSGNVVLVENIPIS